MSAMNKLLAAVQKAKTNSSDRIDEFFYYPARDAAGNGSAVIRFLPSATEEDLPFVKLYTHGFQGPNGKWLIDNCLTTIDEECPVCAENGKLYAAMSKDDARKYGMNRKTSYIARVLVIEDKKNPEHEGNVYLYKFGTKIFDMIADALQPVDEDDKKYNVFGVDDDENNWPNFKLRIRKVDGQVNYGKSTFESGDDIDVDFKAQYNAENNPQKFIQKDKFKSFEALQKRLDFVLAKVPDTRNTPTVSDDEEEVQTKVVKETKTKRTEVETDDDTDDVMNLIRSLAEKSE